MTHDDNHRAVRIFGAKKCTTYRQCCWHTTSCAFFEMIKFGTIYRRNYMSHFFTNVLLAKFFLRALLGETFPSHDCVSLKVLSTAHRNERGQQIVIGLLSEMDTCHVRHVVVFQRGLSFRPRFCLASRGHLKFQ